MIFFAIRIISVHFVILKRWCGSVVRYHGMSQMMKEILIKNVIIILFAIYTTIFCLCRIVSVPYEHKKEEDEEQIDFLCRYNERKEKNERI